MKRPGLRVVTALIVACIGLASTIRIIRAHPRKERKPVLETAKARAAQAESQLLAARKNAVQDQIQRDELAAAVAGVEQAKAKLALARANQRQIEIRRGDVLTAEAAIVSST